MNQDGRNKERIERSLNNRRLYDNLTNDVIDTTNLTADDTVNEIIKVILKYE